MTIGRGCLAGTPTVGSCPRLNDMAAPARAGTRPGVIGVLVNREEDKADRPLRTPELARRFDAVKPRHGDVEHHGIRMGPLSLSKEFASIVHSTDHQTLAGQRVDRHGEHRLIMILKQHA